MNFCDGINGQNAKHNNMDESEGFKNCNLNEHQGLEDFTNICRICASDTTDQVCPIFDGQGQCDDLAEKINKYLPVKVSKDDSLPQGVCEQCRNTLIAWDELVKCSVQAEIMLQQKLSVIRLLYPDKSKQVATAETTESAMKTKKGWYHFNDLVREVLMEYFNELSIEEPNADLEYVCQMCPHHPASKSVKELTQHLKSTHTPLLQNKQSIEEFVKDNITFEETLVADRDGNTDLVEDGDESVANVTAVKLQNYCCPFCESVFSSPARLVYHLNRHIEVSITSGMKCCDKLYVNKSSFVEHLQDTHVTKIPEENVCKTCGITASNFEELETHVREGHPESIDFERKEVLHVGNRQKYIPVVCPECNKVISNKYNLRVHMRSHFDTKAFNCDKCNKTYKSRESLKYHHKICHEGILQFLCSFCGEAFPTRSSRTVHARIHTGAKPFECSHCGKTYRAKNTLDRHMDMHFDVRKYACHLCPKKFRKKTHLDYHLRTHENKSNKRV